MLFDKGDRVTAGIGLPARLCGKHSKQGEVVAIHARGFCTVRWDGEEHSVYLAGEFLEKAQGAGTRLAPPNSENGKDKMLTRGERK